MDRKNIEKFIKKNRVLIISLGLVLLILFSIFGTKIVLFVNFILGNDVIVRLTSDKEVISLFRGQEGNVSFVASVTTNPFCTASCTYSFFDISENKPVEQNEVLLKPGIGFNRVYTLQSNKFGSGIEAYKFNLECKTQRTFLCHTNEEETVRNLLVLMKYSLSDGEKILKDTQKGDIITFTKDIENVKSDMIHISSINNKLIDIMDVYDTTVKIEELDMKLSKNIDMLKGIADTWNKQKYTLVEPEIMSLKEVFADIKEESNELNQSTLGVTLDYNLLVDELKRMQEQALSFRNFALRSDILRKEINNTIKLYNDAGSKFIKKNDFLTKKLVFEGLVDEFEKIPVSVIKKETLKKDILLDISYDAFCRLSGICLDHKTIEERAFQTEYNLDETCKKLDEWKYRLAIINTSINISSYPNTLVFWNNISREVKNIKQNITNQYLDGFDSNSSNGEVIGDFLFEETMYETEFPGGYNLSLALLYEFIDQEQDSCRENFIVNINEYEFEKITTQVNETFDLNIELEDPEPECCIFGKCEPCCTTEECKNDPSTFPIMFVHGHAFNKDLTAEYSLDGFNVMQKKLEEDGYLNSGAISLYTEKDTPYGIWGQLFVPVSIKTSYYFDIFKEPSNYAVVQVSSESIDTYAVRLKELVETVKYKTGKPKVIIIAHSMGGLVSRRYLQIFGSEAAHKLILIGVPNKGIVETTADYCPVVGEKLECRDMNADSLFMNKLNNGQMPNIPIYNIVATGCNMGQGKGDGVVLLENAKLDGANNFIINSTCRQLGDLHTRLINVHEYPEVYYVISEALKN